MGRLLSFIGFLLFAPYQLCAALKIDLLPPSGYDRSAIYLNLALFWIAIIVLIVLIRLKLHEVERVQTMEAREKEEKIPMLD
ncbi:MAG: hypothetical protein ABSE25_14675 [Syntrophorhabdales bacterium]|jgi:hypothetical protein